MFLKYLTKSPETKNQNETNSKPFLNLQQDWAKINLMLKQNNTNLKNCELWEFLILLEQSIILNNNLLGQVINYRMAKIPTKNKYNQDEINHLQKIKQHYQINNNLNDDAETKQNNLRKVFKRWIAQPSK